MGPSTKKTFNLSNLGQKERTNHSEEANRRSEQGGGKETPNGNGQGEGGGFESHLQIGKCF